MVKTTIIAFGLLISPMVFGHGTAAPPPENEQRKIVFPDTASYKTMVLDPHTHSVFSDGHVWPRIRVGEALRDGLDAMAVTEHLEYQPHLDDIPHPDRNRSYREAVSAAEGTSLMVVPGVEITRDLPAGHMNAIFVEDANALFRPPASQDPVSPQEHSKLTKEWPPQQAVEAANEQEAFVFWNHPFWTRDFPTGIPVIPQFHQKNAKNGLLHGIEIANGKHYSEAAFQIALDYDLTLMGSSDIHNLIDWDYEPHNGGHRPVTLVLAEEATVESMREALFDGHTVVWFKNTLIGRPPELNAMLEASLSMHDASYGSREILNVSITNQADANFQLRSKSEYDFFENADMIVVPQHETMQLKVLTGTKVEKIALEFEVVNALTAPKQSATITLEAEVE